MTLLARLDLDAESFDLRHKANTETLNNVNRKHAQTSAGF
jgi:hypothetical protein